MKKKKYLNKNLFKYYIYIIMSKGLIKCPKKSIMKIYLLLLIIFTFILFYLTGKKTNKIKGGNKKKFI